MMVIYFNAPVHPLSESRYGLKGAPAARPTEDSRMIASATPLETCKQDNPQLCYTCIALPENTRC